MSTYITNVETPVLEAWMLARDIIVLNHFHHLPECCFVQEHLDEAMEALKSGDPDQRIYLKSFEWVGNRSATSYDDIFLREVAPKVMGKVEVIFDWEEGAWQTGLIIEDGSILKCEVDRQLRKPEKK